MKAFSMLKITGLLTLLFAIQSSVASAIVDLDVGYAGIASNSGSGNWTVPSATYSGAYGLTAEMRISLPVSSFNFGVRYTNLGINTTYNGQTLIMANSSIAGVLGYRLINTGLAIGPVFTYGLANTGTLENTLANTGTSTSTASSVTQYTVGLEAGIKIPILLLAEVGYGSLAMSGFSNNQYLFGSTTSVTLNGLFARGSVGFSF